MSARHTAGPWSDAGRMNGGIAVIVKGKPREIICSRIGGESVAQGRANARLIAAAPDLISALRNQLRWLRSDNFDAGNRDAYASVIEAAIYLATGERE